MILYHCICLVKICVVVPSEYDDLIYKYRTPPNLKSVINAITGVSTYKIATSLHLHLVHAHSPTVEEGEMGVGAKKTVTVF